MFVQYVTPPQNNSAQETKQLKDDIRTIPLEMKSSRHPLGPRPGGVVVLVAEVVVLVMEDNSVEEVEDDTHVAEAAEDTQVVEAAEDHQVVAVAVAVGDGREILIVKNNITLLLSHNLSFSSSFSLPPMKREKKQKGKRKIYLAVEGRGLGELSGSSCGLR